jgi:ABC-type phosphate transport system substrate-binding protein
MRNYLKILLCALAVSVAARPARAQAAASNYRVIVNTSNGASSLSAEDLQRVYLKKMTTWKDGSAVAVVDQGPKSPVRAAFSVAVLGRDVPSMKNYWQQSLFAGRGVPPIEQPGDAQVAAFVAANPNAIGYVSASAQLPDGVRVIEITR